MKENVKNVMAGILISFLVQNSVDDKINKDLSSIKTLNDVDILDNRFIFKVPYFIEPGTYSYLIMSEKNKTFLLRNDGLLANLNSRKEAENYIKLLDENAKKQNKIPEKYKVIEIKIQGQSYA